MNGHIKFMILGRVILKEHWGFHTHKSFYPEYFLLEGIEDHYSLTKSYVQTTILNVECG